MRKYVSKTLSPEEDLQLQNFLKLNPEYKEILDDLSLADLDKIEQVSFSSNARVQKQLNGGKLKRVLMAAGVVAVLAVGSIMYQQSQGFEFENKSTIATDSFQVDQNLLAVDTVNSVPETEYNGMLIDTFYYINRDEVTPELAIEYIEEKPSKKEVIEAPIIEKKKEDDLIVSKDSIAKPKTDKKKIEQIKVKEAKTYEFVASLDYRQSIAVESNVAAAYKVGQTKSFAGPIGGYEFDATGMPQYGTSDQAFYNYLEEQLQADSLLTKISKKMEAKVSFEVNHKGHVENVNVVKCNHKQLCLKLTEIFENFPDWQPADFKGKKGSVHYVIQVNYE